MIAKKIIAVFLCAAMGLSLAACGSATPSASTPSGSDAAPAQAPSFEAGEYTGKAQGHNGTLEVAVEFSDSAILGVKIVNSAETEHLSKVVFDVLPAKIVAEQALNVDAVTGATISSQALKSAVTDAVKQAKGDPELLKKLAAEKSTEVKELSADVVVVGAGAAGMAAALSADEQGLSVILLEKNAMVGGHTALSGAYSLVTGSELQKSYGVTDDTPQKAYDDNFKNGEGTSVPELLKMFCDNMGEATDWVDQYVGAPNPEKLTALGENSVDRVLVYKGAGPGLSDALEAKIKETKVSLMLDTRATTLSTEDDAVVGVEAVAKDGTTYKIAAKTTVLATGSYGARKDLLPENLKNFVYYGAALSSGDGLEMGQAIGADTVNMGTVELFENGVEWLPGIAKSTYNGSMAAWNVSGILVDRNGNRVVNERGVGIDVVKQQAAQPDSTLFLLADKATFDMFQEKISGYGISQEMLDGWLANNGTKGPIFAHADTIDEVAGIVGIDVANLKATIEKYNGFVASGTDADFGRDAKYMTAKIGEGPYYLIEQKPRYATTLGGLLINPELQVINTDGAVISGLYATGDVAGGVRGNDSIPGADVGWALTSGYWAGKTIPKN